MSITALVTDHSAPAGVRFTEIDTPQPGRDEVIVRNRAISLNYGETRRAQAGREREGLVLGWDTAGTVARVGEGVTAFAPGDRVVTRNVTNGWAQERAAHQADVALIPEGVSFETASTLPTAAVTAWLVLRRFGPLLGSRILITGASGGVGRFAIQLAKLGGATVVAAAGSDHYRDEILALGADEFVIGSANVADPVDYVLESIGGQELFDAFEALGHGGVLQTIGGASGEPTTFPPGALLGSKTRTIIPHRSTEHRVAGPLAALLALIAQGRLDVGEKWVGDWTRFAEASDLLLSRRLGGKAVLTLP